MSHGPMRCDHCAGTDFYVISQGVSYKDGTLLEVYHWPEGGDEADPTGERVFDGGYVVDQELIGEPEMDAVSGPVRALCAGCLRDVTATYLQLGRPQLLPM